MKLSFGGDMTAAHDLRSLPLCNHGSVGGAHYEKTAKRALMVSDEHSGNVYSNYSRLWSRHQHRHGGLGVARLRVCLESEENAVAEVGGQIHVLFD
jgi:hypothetical protein